MHLPKSDVLLIHFWMILRMLAKSFEIGCFVQDDSEHACKSSKGGSFV